MASDIREAARQKGVWRQNTIITGEKKRKERIQRRGEGEREGNRGEEMIDERERRRRRCDKKWMEREMEEER